MAEPAEQERTDDDPPQPSNRQNVVNQRFTSTTDPDASVVRKGKGNPEEWVAVIKPGRILYEMEGVTADIAKEAFRTAAQKIGITTKFVTRTRAL